ncbi:Maltose permease MAL31 [Purpureocillium lavendulum]|uniref:Maltose permease MAL31 n=1 Tax=Purpureocillium lavendulum TaxID=1247861 RepID=A0AB34FLT8_9HYPO|nr:Maltose permease MAL31 [Purpureocillium lavendulum]
MKAVAVILASLAAIATATPTGSNVVCTPATYTCSKNPNTGKPGWSVCNTSGQWVVSSPAPMSGPRLVSSHGPQDIPERRLTSHQFAGDCPPKTVCKFLQSNGSPYCVPPNFQIP